MRPEDNYWLEVMLTRTRAEWLDLIPRELTVVPMLEYDESLESDFARERGVRTIGLLGFDGGLLKPMVDECVWFPSEKGAYGPVESAHSLLCHLITACLALSSARLPATTAAV